MNTIITKILPATDCKGKRIKATAGFDPAEKRALTMNVNDFREDSHKAAAIAFREKFLSLCIGSEMVGGETETGYVWVFTHESSPRI